MGEGFKLKTVKMRGELSQGLCFPLDALGLSADLEVGTDVSELLGVKKWEVVERASTGGNNRGNSS